MCIKYWHATYAFIIEELLGSDIGPESRDGGSELWSISKICRQNLTWGDGQNCVPFYQVAHLCISRYWLHTSRLADLLHIARLWAKDFFAWQVGCQSWDTEYVYRWNEIHIPHAEECRTSKTRNIRYTRHCHCLIEGCKILPQCVQCIKTRKGGKWNTSYCNLNTCERS